jgi:hypothetical protein
MEIVVRKEDGAKSRRSDTGPNQITFEDGTEYPFPHGGRMRTK